MLGAMIAITPGKTLSTHGRGDNRLSIVSILKEPRALAGCHQHAFGACCLAACPILPCTRKRKHAEEVAKNLSALKTCQNSGCPLSLALADL